MARLGKAAMSLVGAAAIAAAAYGLLRPAPVTVAVVGRGTATEAAYAAATVEALDRAFVKARVTGTVVELLVREGDLVKKDALLARIEAPSVEADIGRSRADLASLVAQGAALSAELQASRAEEERTRKLARQSAVPSSEVDRVTSRVSVLSAQLAGVQAQERTLRQDLAQRSSGPRAGQWKDLEIRAPLEGIVLRRLVTSGDFVAANQTLFRVGDLRTLVVECAVDEVDMPRVGKDTRAIIGFRAFPGSTFTGKVLEIPQDLDRERRAFLVKVAIEAPPEGLRGGMGAEVNLVLRERIGALLVPTEALDREGKVWLVEGGRAARRSLRIGVRGRRAVEVLEGVDEGAQVIVQGMEDLRPGKRVSVSSSGSPPGAPSRGTP